MTMKETLLNRSLSTMETGFGYPLYEDTK